MKKKSTLFALIAVACIAVALYFMYRETRDSYDLGEIDPEPEPAEDPEPAEVTTAPADNEQQS